MNPGRTASLHRLNRAEYANAVRDLLAVEVDAHATLPPDEQAFGFENNAEALSMPPALLDRYVSAAAAIARRAVGDPNMPPTFVRYGAIKNNPNDLTYLRQTDRLGEDFPLGTKGGVAARHYFPVDGEYVFKLRLQRAWDNIIRGLNVPNQIEIRVDGRARGTIYDRRREVAVQDLSVRRRRIVAGARARESRPAPGDGDHAQIRQRSAGGRRAPDRLSPYSRSSDNASSPIAIAALLIGGPYEGKVPLDSPSRQLLYVCRPANAADEAPCATKILSNLARRAYRRAAAMKTCKRSSASTTVRARPEASTTGFAPRWSACW